MTTFNAEKSERLGVIRYMQINMEMQSSENPGLHGDPSFEFISEECLCVPKPFLKWLFVQILLLSVFCKNPNAEVCNINLDNVGTN